MKFDKTIEDNQSILYVIKPELYQDFLRDFTKTYMNKGLSCYVALSRPYQSLMKSMEKIKIDTDNIFFIDTSTRMAGHDGEETNNCLFIESPSALTSLSIAMHKVIEASEPKIVFFDSLSTLLIYNPEKMIIKFTTDMINKMSGGKSKLILLCLDGKDEANIIEKISMFVDKMEKIN